MAGRPPHVEIVFILSYLSLGLSILIMIFSMIKLEYAYTTFFTASALSLMTIPYHVVVLHAHRRDMKGTPTDQLHRDAQLLYPSSTTTSLVCLYLLAVSWILPLGLASWKIAHWPGDWNAIMQLVLIAMEVVVLVAVATICTRKRYRPRNWATVRDDLCVLAIL